VCALQILSKDNSKEELVAQVVNYYVDRLIAGDPDSPLIDPVARQPASNITLAVDKFILTTFWDDRILFGIGEGGGSLRPASSTFLLCFCIGVHLPNQDDLWRG
jgi:hypothetical protein